MPTFKQKNVIKTYKLRLQEKLKTVSEETENATSFLNNCLSEFKNRVQYILEIKDEKCLTLYRKLIRDLENYSEKLFIFQASLTEEESESSEDEEPSSINNSENLKEPSKECLFLNASPENNTKAFLEESEPVARNTCVQTEACLSLSSCIDKDVNLVSCEAGDGSITEDDFYSLHSDIYVQNIKQSNSQVEKFSDKCQSSQSFSQSSCYRSLSSNICDSIPVSFCDENKSNQCEQYHSSDLQKDTVSETQKSNICVCSPAIAVPSSISATISHVINPGDFWIQLEIPQSLNLRFLKSDYSHISCPSYVTEGTFCLAPFKTTPFLCRGKSLSNAKYEKEIVKILFIDHGSSQDIPLCDLRPLPWSAYDTPVQAIHCCLYGIAPINGVWTDECIDRFKDFQNFCIETTVKLKKNDLYAVQLIAKLSADLDEDFSVDIGQCLCLDGLAVAKSDFFENVSGNETTAPQFSKPAFVKNSPSLEVSISYDFNALSSDSGVSVTSAKSSQIPQKNNPRFDQKKSEDSRHHIPTENRSVDSCNKKTCDTIDKRPGCDLISFTSFDSLDLPKSNITKLSRDLCTSNYHVCNATDFCIHLTVPSPSLLFVEKNMMLVMLSHIESPHEFYVNMAMENSMSLDELREQMTSTYESQSANIPKINIMDLSENMFCAARYVDGYWYRVKILCINKEDRVQDQALVQYIDYGNSAFIKCCNLRPLASQFSHHPSFGVKCSLAGVIPIEENGVNNSFPSNWSKDAINAFKELTSFERCLTAQICTELCSNVNEILPVFLWDTEGSEDLLINVALADCGMATFDNNLLRLLTMKPKISSSPKDVNVLDVWDPMSEEYYDIENSYGVNTDEVQVATSGYEARDEEYTCKYFSLRGFCPRGDNCPYMHIPLLESGVTRDQEEVYCLDSVPLISENMNILVQISVIISPTHFYVVLPFGCKDVNEIDSLVFKGKAYGDILNTEAKSLFYAMNKYYSNAPFVENTMIALSCGTIVAAHCSWDKQWHRGRIVDVSDVNAPAKVFFVDVGNSEWVPRHLIRTILPQFLHTPFQAMQCSLYAVEPVGFKENKTWSSEAVNFFKDCVAEEILLAKIVHRFGSVFHVSLRKTHENDNLNIGQLLVSKGHAQHHAVVQSKKKETLYVPG